MTRIATIAACLALAACAGRAPAPVATSQHGDGDRDCIALNAEMADNSRKMAALGGEKGAKVAQNVAAGVAGVLFFPLWFAMDFQGAAGTEEAALQNRNAHLAGIARQKSC